MTKRLRLGLLLMAVMLCNGVASSQSFLTIYKQNGWPLTSFGLQDVNKITFDNNGNMIVNQTTGNESVDINNVMAIKFTADNKTAIEKIDNGINKVSIITSENAIIVKGADRGSVAIWAVNGQQVYNNGAWQGENIVTSQLPRGIYIIKINNSTFKFKK